MERAKSEGLDEILGKKFPVLDDGFVRVVDYMGNDQSIVQAARISYGAGTKTVREDRGLIRYLIRNRHTSPIEQCEIKFHIRIPMDAWRQFVRHRTLSINEYSTRYSVAIDRKQETGPTQWRTQAKDNKQGSGDFIDPTVGNRLTEEEDTFHKEAERVYNERLEAGVAREQARKDLPLSTYTEAYVKVDLHNLMHFLSLRLDSHAQKEIREYAEVMADIVNRWCPLAWEAFEDYRQNAESFSAMELEAVRKMFRECKDPEDLDLKSFGLSKREIKDLYRKLDVPYSE